MRRAVSCLALAGLLAVGCERTVSEQKSTVQHRDGTVTQSSTTVKEAPDGSRSVEPRRRWTADTRRRPNDVRSNER